MFRTFLLLVKFVIVVELIQTLDAYSRHIELLQKGNVRAVSG